MVEYFFILIMSKLELAVLINILLRMLYMVMLPYGFNTSVSDENIKIKGATGTTTLILKHDGELKFDVTPDLFWNRF